MKLIFVTAECVTFICVSGGIDWPIGPLACFCRFFFVKTSSDLITLLATRGMHVQEVLSLVLPGYFGFVSTF